jgi:branched-chain amino acid transport system substrate-binding protein
MSLNYTAAYVVAGAMKLAGTTSDPVKIRAQADKAAASLDTDHNPNGIEGVSDNGAFKADVVVGVVEEGKIRQVRLSELMKD